jgi:hypothetical protein
VEVQVFRFQGIHGNGITPGERAGVSFHLAAQQGDSLVSRRVIPFALSLGLALAVTMVPARSLSAQEVKKELAKPEGPKAEAPKKEEAKSEQTKPTEAAKKEAEKPQELPAPTIPKAVEEKLEAARRAVAEAIVAAQDAGLVDSSIDPPPILDILIKGYAWDARTLKDPSAKKTYWAVTPEVFCGWFTSYGKQPEGVTINPQTDIRIVPPSAGLKAWYDQRANMLNRHIEEVRKAKGQTGATKPAEMKKEATKPAEIKKEEVKQK